jgi:hypothetical protein
MPCDTAKANGLTAGVLYAYHAWIHGQQRRRTISIQAWRQRFRFESCYGEKHQAWHKYDSSALPWRPTRHGHVTPLGLMSSVNPNIKLPEKSSQLNSRRSTLQVNKTFYFPLSLLWTSVVRKYDYVTLLTGRINVLLTINGILPSMHSA